jgi:hypothetical protein
MLICNQKRGIAVFKEIKTKFGSSDHINILEYLLIFFAGLGHLFKNVKQILNI